LPAPPSGGSSSTDCTCGICVECAEEESFIDPRTGHIIFRGPGHTWTQGAAVHATGTPTRAVFSKLRARGIKTTNFHNADWTLISTGNDRSFITEGDITATGHMVLGGNANLANTLGRPFVITVGENLYIGNAPTTAPAEVRTAAGTQTNSQNITGETIVFVGGNLVNTAQQMGSTNGRYGSNVTYYVVGTLVNSSSFNIPSGARIHTNAGDTSVTVNGHTMTVNEWVAARTEIENNMPDWGNIPTITNTLALNWGDDRATAAGRITATQRDNLRTRYGINVSDSMTGSLWYVDRNTIISQPSGTNNRNGVQALIIDTGTDPNNTVYIQMGVNPATGTANFQWNTVNPGSSQNKVAVLTVGNGSVVFVIPNNVIYVPTQGMFKGPFNLAVAARTDNTQSGSGWLGCNRLNAFTYSVNQASSYIPWLERLMTTTGPRAGFGVLRDDIGVAGFGPVSNYNASNPAATIAARNHTHPLNMNVFLVHNGTRAVAMQDRSFFAGSIYAPNTTVSMQDNAGGSITHFGSIAARTVNIDAMSAVIALLPGGGLAPEEDEEEWVDFPTGSRQGGVPPLPGRPGFNTSTGGGGTSGAGNIGSFGTNDFGLR
jgi:hypothetical protein